MDSCAYCDAKPFYRDHESGLYLCPIHAWLEVSGPRREAPRPPLTIRPAMDADRPCIVEMANYFWDEEEIDCFGRTYQVGALPAYVACDEGEVVGVASYAYEDDALNLVMLDIMPQWQGRGAAHGLMAAVIQEAEAEGMKRIIVATTNDNLPSLGLYQRLGFTITDILIDKLVEHHGGVELGFDGIPVRDEIQLELQL